MTGRDPRVEMTVTMSRAAALHFRPGERYFLHGPEAALARRRWLICASVDGDDYKGLVGFRFPRWWERAWYQLGQPYRYLVWRRRYAP